MAEPLVTWTMGDVVRKLRDRRGWTQEMLADKAGLDRTTIHRLETASDKPERRTIERTAKALDLRVADFYEFEEVLEWCNALMALPDVRRRRIGEAILEQRRADPPDPAQDPPADANDADSASAPPATARTSRGKR